MTAGEHRLVVGVGSFHGDDRAGWIVADRLAELWAGDDLTAVRRALTPTDLLDWLDGVVCVHICDACQWSEDLQGVQRLTLCSPAAREAGRSLRGDHSQLFSTPPGRGSHDFSILDVLNLAQHTGRLPQRVILWGIPGCRFQPGDPVTETVLDLVSCAAAEIHRELQEPL